MENHVDVTGLEARGEVLQRHDQPGGLQARRVDVNQQRTHPGDTATHCCGRVPEVSREVLLPDRRRTRGGTRYHEGGAGELLDDTVVQGARDAATLVGRGLHRPLEESLTLNLRLADPAPQPPDDRN